MCVVLDVATREIFKRITQELIGSLVLPDGENSPSAPVPQKQEKNQVLLTIREEQEVFRSEAISTERDWCSPISV